MRIVERIGTAAKWTWTVVAGMVTTALTGAAPMPVDPGPAAHSDEPEDPDEDVSPEPRETP